ncbi:hypothetical protein E2320_013711, partial [Naja naja]
MTEENIEVIYEDGAIPCDKMDIKMFGKSFLPILYGLVFTIGMLLGNECHWISSPNVHHELLLSADHPNIAVLQKPVQTKSYESDFTC